MTNLIDLSGVSRAGRRPQPPARGAPAATVALGAVRVRPGVVVDLPRAAPAVRGARPQPAWRRPAGIAPGVRRVLAGAALIAAYVAVCLAPLAIVSIGSHAPGRPFLVELSVALGYVGLAMLVLQFTLVSRIKWLAAPFGIDILQRFHRQVSFVALGFVLAHPALLLVQSVPTYLPLFDLRTAPWRARFAVASVAALLFVVFVSLWRRKLRLSYEIWKLTHGALSVSVMFLALAHMVGVNRFTSTPGGRAVVALVAAAILLILVWSRLLAPRKHGFRPWRVVDVIPERGRAFTVVVEPDRHPGWSFLPGQFAWVTVGRSPYRHDHHPFSLSSPADVDVRGRVAMTIKQAGDWTRGVGSIDPGTRVHLDGPHGSFSIDLHQAPGYVFVAGGVGITPIYSMIATMFLREDSRPALLFYTNSDWDSVTFREQLDELEGYMPNLRVVHLLKQPPPGWRGPSGRLTADVLGRYLPWQYRSFEYFLCASEATMDATEDALLELGVSDYRIHSERFAMV
ncbi:MAG TPA: ferric reductase-like transmembrane domain-containing protein [Terriglobales bacterium]|nr:ferric reductase-like transmembrane domain-containing protein [Terriglobales bacterium]